MASLAHRTGSRVLATFMTQALGGSAGTMAPRAPVAVVSGAGCGSPCWNKFGLICRRASVSWVVAPISATPAVHSVNVTPSSPSSARGCTSAAAAAAITSEDHEDRKIRIVGIAGSLRTRASNRGLIRAAAEIAASSFPNVEFSMVEIGELPLYNTDLESKHGGFPPAVVAFREKVKAADAVLIATPEYNYSIPGALKNAIDWGSRTPNVFEGKPGAIMGSGGYMGTARAQYHLRQVAVFLNLKLLNKPEVFVNLFAKPSPFDGEGNLTGEDVRAKVEVLLKELHEQTVMSLAFEKMR